MRAFPKLKKIKKRYYSEDDWYVYVFWGEHGLEYTPEGVSRFADDWHPRDIVDIPEISANKARKILRANIYNSIPDTFPN